MSEKNLHLVTDSVEDNQRIVTIDEVIGTALQGKQVRINIKGKGKFEVINRPWRRKFITYTSAIITFILFVGLTSGLALALKSALDSLLK